MMTEIRCKGIIKYKGKEQTCGRKLGFVAGDYEIKCPRCGQINSNIKNNASRETGSEMQKP